MTNKELIGNLHMDCSTQEQERSHTWFSLQQTVKK